MDIRDDNRCRVHGALGLWELGRAEPDRIAIIDEHGKQTTYGALSSWTSRIAIELLKQHCKREDVVAVLLPNQPLFLAVQLAVHQIGMYFTPINIRLTISEISYILANAEPAVVVTTPEFTRLATAAVAEAGRTTIRKCKILPLGNMDNVVNERIAFPVRERRAGQDMFYTSGTTGTPKGVRRTVESVTPEEALAKVLPEFANRYGLTPGKGIHLVSSPLYHVGPNVMALRSLHIGHSVVLLGKWMPEDILIAIQRYSVTTLQMVPTIFVYLLALPFDIRRQYDLSTLTHIVHVGAMCPQTIKRQMIEWVGPILHEIYAATEIGCTHVDSADWLRHPGTVGRAVPGTEVMIVGEDGRKLANGEVGLIYIRRDTRGFEYFKDRAKTDACRLNDYVTLGDVGYQDDEGWLYLCDRQADVISTGGMKVYPAEVEAVLLNEPSVLRAVVIGVPDALLGHRVVAIVEASDASASQSAIEQRLIRQCRDNLANYKRPTEIEFATLPEMSSSKLSRTRVRDVYIEEHVASD